MMQFLLAITIIFLGLFTLLYHVKRTSLATGFVFISFLLTAVVTALLYLGDVVGTPWAYPLVLLIFAPALLLLVFGVYILVGYLLLNTVAIVRREGRALQHMLTLLLALGIIALLAVRRFVPMGEFSGILRALVWSVYGLIAYYALHVSLYVVNSFLCNAARPKKNQDYIIILGCGLRRDGTATPLLAARVDKAITFYRQQQKKGAPPKLLCSGGKGSDEMRSEAEAMADYARSKGIPEDDLLLESRSVNTLENMRFSKEIMDAQGKPYRCIYATSNYHVLRAGIYARRAGLRMSGIGGKTAFYFLANAFLREYVAYLKLYLKWNIIFAAVFFMLGVLAVSEGKEIVNAFLGWLQR